MIDEKYIKLFYRIIEKDIEKFNIMYEEGKIEGIIIKGTSDLPTTNILKKFNPGIKFYIDPIYEGRTYNQTIISRYKEVPYYNRNCAIYSLEEIIKIVSEIEALESTIDDSWNNLEKTIYISYQIAKNISYDFTLEQEKYNHSLRGIITGKTVCEGYALILKDILDRQYIECGISTGDGRVTEKLEKLPQGKVIQNNHAWNVVELYFDYETRRYPIDITQLYAAIYLGYKDPLKVILTNNEMFKDTHHRGFGASNKNLASMPLEKIHEAAKKVGIPEYISRKPRVIKSSNEGNKDKQGRVINSTPNNHNSQLNNSGKYKIFPSSGIAFFFKDDNLYVIGKDFNESLYNILSQNHSFKRLLYYPLKENKTNIINIDGTNITVIPTNSGYKMVNDNLEQLEVNVIDSHKKI